MRSFLNDSEDEQFTSRAGYQVTKNNLFELLEENTWLNDQIINSCLETFHFDSNNIRLTDTFFFTELTSSNQRLSNPNWSQIFQSHQIWVIPINFEKHWSLMLLRLTTDGVVLEFWDSLPSKPRFEKIKLQLLSSCRQFSKQKTPFYITFNNDCYIQTDLNNCGIFLVGNIYAFIFKKLQRH